MDLTPLYDLRARLRAGAIAGAALAAEDFRLRRALEDLAPLAGVSPVFQKLSQLTAALLSPDCPDRAGALLEAITLADAVLCTQAAAALPDPVEPLLLRRRGSAVTNAPYSVLAPLLEALTTSGGGRYSFVLDTYEQRRELFRDYRVMDALVAALGAAYSELADKAEEWLSREDERILPLLEAGFDPRGKKEMVRRVHVMEAVAGSGANDFYLSRLPEAEKEVRAALIYALRHETSNAEKLVELCKTEKGACKKTAHWALAKLEAPAAWAYWDRLAEKRPDQAVEYMALAATEHSSALVADALDRWLAPYEAAPSVPIGQKEMEQLQTLLGSLPGKSGAHICRLYRRMAALGAALDDKSYRQENGQTMAVRFSPFGAGYSRSDHPFSEVLPLVLRRAILLHPSSDLLDLPGELEQTGERSYLVPALTAALLSKSAGEAFALAQPLLKNGGLLHKRRQKKNGQLLWAALDGIGWDEDRRTLTLHCLFSDPAGGPPVTVTRPLREPLDARWYDLLTAPGGDELSDGLLSRLLVPTDPALCALLGNYFYRRALTVEDNRPYLQWLRACGWTDCRGLLEAYCKRRRVSTWELRSCLTQLPGPPRAQADEAERVLALIQEKRISVGSWNPTPIQERIADLRRSAAPSGEGEA